MNLECQFNTAAFEADIRQYAAVKKMELPDAINKKMLFVLRGALRETPKANAGTIKTTLSAPAYMKGRTVAEAIVLWRNKKNGVSFAARGQLQAAAKKLIDRRGKAVGSLRAGWVKSIKIISAAANETELVEGKSKVKQAGRASPASPSETPVATSTYNLAIRKRNGGFEIDPRVEKALKTAFEKEAASTEAYLLAKLSGVKS